MSVPAGYYEDIWAQMAVRAMAKRIAAPQRDPNQSHDMWDQLQDALGEFKSAHVVAEEIGRAYSSVIVVLRNHACEMESRPLPYSKTVGGVRTGKEWRLKAK